MADAAASPADLTATDALTALAAGQVSSVGLVTACLERIAASDGELRAWTHVDREGALRTAEMLDAHRKRGLPLGPLHGLPVGIKDIIDVAGMPGENLLRHGHGHERTPASIGANVVKNQRATL